MKEPEPDLEQLLMEPATMLIDGKDAELHEDTDLPDDNMDLILQNTSTEIDDKETEVQDNDTEVQDKETKVQDKEAEVPDEETKVQEKVTEIGLGIVQVEENETQDEGTELQHDETESQGEEPVTEDKSTEQEEMETDIPLVGKLPFPVMATIPKAPTVITVKPATSTTENTAILCLVPVPKPAVVTSTSAEEADGIAPKSIATNQKIVTAAQAEVKKLDVLVCGKCHRVFHFVEEFIDHKTDPSCIKPAFRTNINESKPQVWAFLLWKANTGAKLLESEPDGTSWGLYKRWCKLSQAVRDTWVAAGKAIQVSTTLGAAQVKHVAAYTPEHQTKKARRNSNEDADFLTNDSKTISKTPVKTPGRPGRKPMKRLAVDIKEEVMSEDEEEKEQPAKKVTRRLRANTCVPVKPKLLRSKTRTAKKDGAESSEEENYVVERILAKRYNAKIKQFEYLLKWEGYPQDQNTWEPVNHMEECDKLVETFERNLAKQNMLRAKAATVGPGHKVVTKVVKLPPKPEPSIAGPSGESGRPVRSSKTKAMENVKSWCGSIGKRKAEDSDSDEPFGKKIKEEPDYDDDEEDDDEETTPGLLKSLSLIKSPPANKVLQQVNGVKKTPTKTIAAQKAANQGTPPVLVANSKGVIKVDPRQVPNLTSGVYIVSNQSGVVKLGTPPTSPPKEAKQATPVRQSANVPKMLPKGSPGASGIIRVPGQQGARRPLPPRIPVGGNTTPRAGMVRSPNPRVLGPRPVNSLAARPGLRPPFVPRPPNVLRPPLRPPGQPRGMLGRPPVRTSPAAQVKSGVRPIQAMLGGNEPTQIVTVQVPKKKLPGDTSSLLKSGGSPAVQKPARPYTKKVPAARSRLAALLEDFTGSNRTSKLVNNDSLHMEFQESDSEEEASYNMPEIPMGEAKTPSPPGSPLPLTLCPETGKILGQAEGEPIREPTPERRLEESILPELEDHGIEGAVDGSVTMTRLTGVDGETIKLEGEEGAEYVTITGEDGVVYQIATHGQDLIDGQTMLMTEDGQQCVYMTSDDPAGDDKGELTLDSAVAEAVAQLLPGEGGIGHGSQIVMTGDGGQIVMTTGEDGESTMQAQVVAQIVDGDQVPGGMRRVVLLLPDGNFMMTEVDEEQYLALNLDK